MALTNPSHPLDARRRGLSNARVRACGSAVRETLDGRGSGSGRGEEEVPGARPRHQSIANPIAGGSILTTRRSMTRIAGLLATSAIVFAACSSSGATTAPSAAAPSEAAPSEAAPSAAASTAMDAKDATSAADMGGVDAVCAAGKAEGQVNLIATPPDWANYGQMITDFTAKYGIKVQSDQPDADSQTEINTAKQLAGTGRQPDLFDLGTVVALANTDMYAPVQGGHLGGHPRREQGGDRALGQQLHRASRRSATTPRSATSPRSPTSPIPSTRARSPSTAIRSRRPPASTASSWPRSPTAARPTTSRPASTSSRSSPTSATSSRSTRPRPRSRRAQTPIVIDWTYNNGAQIAALAPKGIDLEDRRPDATRRRSPRTTTRRSTRTPRIRRPPAAGWSTSSRTPARTPG